VQGPGSELAGRRHHLPDRIDPVRGGTEFEDSTEEHGAQVYLANSWTQNRQRVGHRELIQPLRVADARDFVGCLYELRGADHIGGIDPVKAGSPTQHRVSLVVDADTGAGREMVGERRGKGLDAVVEIRKQRTVQMIAGKVCRAPSA
jgi:hypothetical protein